MTLAVFALVLLPGVGFTWAIFSTDRLKPPTQLACFIGLGYATVSLWGTVLTILHIFSAWPFLIGLALLTAAAWVVALRKRSLPQRITDLRAQCRSEGWSLALGAIGVVAAAVALWNMSPLVNFGFANPWRYWADGLELAATGQVPSETLQWGRAYSPAASKLIFNAFNGGVSFISSEPLVAMGPLMKLNVVGMAIGAWAVARELGMKYAGPLLTVGAVALSPMFLRHSFTFDPRRLFVGESFAEMIAACALAVGINALRNRDWRTALVGGVIFGAAAGTHLVPIIVILGFFLAYALVHGIVDKGLVPIAKLAGAIAAMCLLLPAAALFLGGGSVGFEGAQAGDEYSTENGTFDPTLFLIAGAADQPLEMQPGERAEANHGWYDPPADLATWFVAGATRIPPDNSGALIAVSALLIVVAVSALWFLPGPLKAVPLAALLLGIGLIALSLIYSYVYETYVPARFPQRRFLAYDSLPLILLVLPLLEGVLLLLRRARSWLPDVVAAILVVALAITVLPTASPKPWRATRATQAVKTIDWIRANVPCDARMLVTQRTGGLFQSLTGRASILEGMAPYLRPAMLEETIEVILDTRDFLADPQGSRDFVTKYDVDYVLAVKRHGMFDGNSLIHRHSVQPDLLNQADFLELVRPGRLVGVYEVDRSLLPDDAPEPTDFPGYICRREPTPLGG